MLDGRVDAEIHLPSESVPQAGAEASLLLAEEDVPVAHDHEQRRELGRGERGGRAPRERNYDFDARKVYFGNLSWGMDHLDLQDLCGEYGEVADSRLITDRETGRSRGFGFVTMSSAEQAEKVVNGLNGQDVDGRVLRVNIANVDGR